MIHLIQLILLVYILGITVLIIDTATDIQRQFFEQNAQFATIYDCVKIILKEPKPILLTSWIGLLLNLR